MLPMRLFGNPVFTIAKRLLAEDLGQGLPQRPAEPARAAAA